jgi:hypothetical protein
MDGKEPSNKVGSVGGDPHARTNEGGYDNNNVAKEGGGGLCHGMVKREAAMAVPELTAARFAE